MVLESALLCLALNIYHEARSESVAGQQAVALVTMNRAGYDPSRVCDTVFAPKQFSWTTSRSKRVKGGYKLKKSGVPREGEAWKSAVFTARLVMRNKVGDFTRGATHYHANYVNPTWRYDMRMVLVIGKHHFYRNIA